MTKSSTKRDGQHADREPRPWRLALAWLCFLGPFFFLTYGFANWLASTRTGVGAIVFDWEQHIPFLAWTIIPYWSIDLLYGLSLFICTTRTEVGTHARRLLTAQIISIACFIALPLQFTFERPAADGVPGLMFDALAGFDKPFNQAPSLHISLLLIIWARLAAHAPRWLSWPLHGWMLLIGASVLTTYQHHFIDLPTGMLAGFVCLWLWPMQGPAPMTHAGLATAAPRRKLAGYYFAGALAMASIAMVGGGAWLWLWWVASALALVALCYLVCGVHAFQKGPDGAMSLAARWLFAPYLVGAWINSRVWTRGRSAADHVAADVWLGRIPGRAELARAPYRAVVDLTGEMHATPAAGATRYIALPMLDLVTPDPVTLAQAVHAIESAPKPVLVCCALGYSRSACAVAAWLLRSGRAHSAAEAVAMIERARPQVVLGPHHHAAIAGACA
jgi:hypothetical protein